MAFLLPQSSVGFAIMTHAAKHRSNTSRNGRDSHSRKDNVPKNLRTLTAMSSPPNEPFYGTEPFAFVLTQKNADASWRAALRVRKRKRDKGFGTRTSSVGHSRF